MCNWIYWNGWSCSCINVLLKNIASFWRFKNRKDFGTTLWRMERYREVMQSSFSFETSTRWACGQDPNIRPSDRRKCWSCWSEGGLKWKALYNLLKTIEKLKIKVKALFETYVWVLNLRNYRENSLIKKEVYLNLGRLMKFKNETIFRMHWGCIGRLQGVDPW